MRRLGLHHVRGLISFMLSLSAAVPAPGTDQERRLSLPVPPPRRLVHLPLASTLIRRVLASSAFGIDRVSLKALPC